MGQYSNFILFSSLKVGCHSLCCHKMPRKQFSTNLSSVNKLDMRIFCSPFDRIHCSGCYSVIFPSIHGLDYLCSNINLILTVSLKIYIFGNSVKNYFVYFSCVFLQSPHSGDESFWAEGEFSGRNWGKLAEPGRVWTSYIEIMYYLYDLAIFGFF